MANKRIILLIGILLITAGAIGVFLIERDGWSTAEKENATTEAVKPSRTFTPAKVAESNKNAIKADLQQDSNYYIPLVSIADTAQLPSEIRKKINGILENSQGCYIIKQNPETKEIFIILQNPAEYNYDRYSRHNLQVASIDGTGHINITNIGYNGQENEIDSAVVKKDSDEWIFDETTEPYKPLKHVAYNKRKVLYTETWNYDDSEPVKYEMKDKDGNVISVKKEMLDGDSGYRLEHIFYDGKGNTEKSMTANYDGANIKWFTYYDAKAPGNCVTIESEYEDGLKTGEKVYNNSFKLIKTVNASYKDGKRTELTVTDSENNISNYIEK